MITPEVMFDGLGGAVLLILMVLEWIWPVVLLGVLGVAVTYIRRKMR
jgi:hypothetical protein